MEKFILRSFKSALVLLPFALVSCSGSGLEQVYGIDSNTQVVGVFSQYDNAKITTSGTGMVRFNSIVTSASSRSFALKATLDQTISNSSVAVMAYATDNTFQSNTGVMITFARNGVNVTATVSINGTTRTVNSSRLVYYYPASLDLIIDVHNVNSQARVLVWRRDATAYTADTADIDTERSGDLSSSLPVSTAAGTIWGLSITNATVSAATVGPQKLLD